MGTSCIFQSLRIKAELADTTRYLTIIYDIQNGYIYRLISR